MKMSLGRQRERRDVVEAVLFDLFETLITESATRPPGASSLGERLGLEPGAFRKQWKQRRSAITLGRLSFVDAIADIGVALGSPVDAAQLEELRRERMRVKARPLEMIEASVIALIDQLLQRGKRIAVISNCFAEDVATWSESCLAKRVHLPVFSFDVGLAKPDPAIYREAMRRLGITPDAAVFVGDGDDDELIGATQAGLHAFRAAWFLSRWNNRFSADSGDRTLRRPEDVLPVAV
jgi:putative hydrolase of the HAD superfamily